MTTDFKRNMHCLWQLVCIFLLTAVLGTELVRDSYNGGEPPLDVLAMPSIIGVVLSAGVIVYHALSWRRQVIARVRSKSDTNGERWA